MLDDDVPEPEDIDLAEWPEALEAYRVAYDLARESAGDGAIIRDRRPPRELIRLNERLPLRPLAPADLARIRIAIRWGEADGAAGAGPRW